MGEPTGGAEQAPHRKEIRPRIGVLAIQGDFAAHAQALEDAGAEAVSTA
jgi:hypothetical protein